jgi:ABC-type nitrate/sulfonate/bicarbonate transport system substrate-binding protein
MLLTKKYPKRNFLVAAISFGLISLFAACNRNTASTGKIRIGWQVPWATQGQVVQVLKHTDVLDLNGLKAEFKGFNYGGPLNEAALAGDVDALFTADQPAASLLAKGGKYTIVARLMYNRVAIYVPPDSPLRSVADLKGKKIAMPFGAAAQRDALKAIQQAGIDPGKEITAINLDIYEQNNIVQRGSRSSWGDIDALVGFDPTPAILEFKGLARMLHVGQVVSLVLISDSYLKTHADEARRFLQAFLQAWHYYANHQSQANQWFQEESRLEFEPRVLDLAASVEPNIKAQSIDLLRPTLNQADIETAQSAAKFIHDHGMAKVEVNMTDHYDPQYINAALQHVTTAANSVQLKIKQ